MAEKLGAGKQSKLMAISKGPSINYTNSKRTSTAGFTLIQSLDNSKNTAKHTTFNGQSAYLLDKTKQPTCMGDEPGWAGGVKSGTVGRKVKPTSGSSSIIVEGKQLVREGDTCTMNNGNVVGKYVSVTPNATKPLSQSSKTQKNTYGEGFTLTVDETEEPINDHVVWIKRQNGNFDIMKTGTTGDTPQIKSDKAEAVNLLISPQLEIFIG